MNTLMNSMTPLNIQLMTSSPQKHELSFLIGMLTIFMGILAIYFGIFYFTSLSTNPSPAEFRNETRR